MKERYSFFALARHAVNGRKPASRVLQRPTLQPAYDAVIIGGGGHGLATAYFLAKEHGMKNIAVLERGAIGQGNSGRNTQVVRSDYFHLASSKILRALAEALRGPQPRTQLQHHAEPARQGLPRAQPARDGDPAPSVNAIRMNGVDSEMLTPQELKKLEPMLNLDSRYPIAGAAVQWRGGISRHDAVVWAFARAAGRSASTSCRAAK